MSEQKVGCVPDGYMPIPTAEQIADALDGVRCFHDMSAELIAPELLVNLLGAPTVKAEQADEAKRIDKQCRDDVAAALGFVSGGNFAWSYLLTQIKECVRVAEAPSLPAAGSAELIAEAERCLFVLREIGSMDADDITGDDVDLRFEDEEGRDTGCDVSIVDYAEKSADVIEKMIAALSAQQSAHVSVPRELLERVATHLEWDGDESQTVIQYANKCDALAAELSALLNGGEA
jgi:hypothetical protein